MSTRHKIRPGEHLARLAYVHGHRSVEELWEADANAQLRDRRPDPGVLGVGDVVEVPVAAPFQFDSQSVGQRHRLELDLPYPKVRIQLAYANEAPVVAPQASASAAFDNEVHPVPLDGEGVGEFELGPFTETLQLTVRGRTLHCSVATLQPIETFAGVHDRLANLGYEPGGRRGRRPKDGVTFLSAVQEFQCDHGLKVDGDPGKVTKAKLVEVCGA